MKTLICSFFVLILFHLHLFPQWSTDPNNNLIIGYGQDPHICSDSAGGCYITYDYGSLNYPQKLAVERLDKYGYKPWGSLKQILGELEEQWLAEIVEDGEGGVIISYLDDTIVGTNFTYRVRVQKVDSSGNFLWGSTGIRVTTTEINHGDQAITSDGNGGCIVVWPNQLPNFTYEFRANRFNNLGVRTWSDTGIFLENNINSDPARIIRVSDGNYYVQIRRNLYRISENGEIIRRDSVTLGNILPDQAGGLVLSGKTGTINNIKLVAQRNDSLGNNLWQEPYVEIADSLDIGSSLNILSNNNYYHYGWLGKKNGVAEILQIQSLRSNGTKLFIGGSISLSDYSTSITSIPIISSHAGSNIYAWTHWDSPQTYNANYARRIDTTGADIWKIGLVILNRPSLGYFSMTTDCFGGAIGVGYLNSDFAIRVLKVSVNGILGEIITDVEGINETSSDETILYQNFPNPFNSSTIIKYQIPDDGKIKISIYNILGERLIVLSDEYKSKGTYSLVFNSENLPTGIFIYTLESNIKLLAKKFTIIK